MGENMNWRVKNLRAGGTILLFFLFRSLDFKIIGLELEGAFRLWITFDWPGGCFSWLLINLCIFFVHMVTWWNRPIFPCFYMFLTFPSAIPMVARWCAFSDFSPGEGPWRGTCSQVAIVESEDTKNWINMSLSRSLEGRKRRKGVGAASPVDARL